MLMSSMRRLPFTQFDVFTSRALEGNPLAVFPDGRSLSDDEMQAIAKEMNLSETTYILPRDAATEKERGARVRIFTLEKSCRLPDIPRWARLSRYAETAERRRS